MTASRTGWPLGWVTSRKKEQAGASHAGKLLLLLDFRAFQATLRAADTLPGEVGMAAQRQYE